MAKSRPEALLDSNVVGAALVQGHLHHTPSARLFLLPERHYAIAAHSYAEAYNVLTRTSGPAPYAFAPQIAWRALQSVVRATQLVGLTPLQIVDGIRRFAEADGTGPRLYDALIAEAAMQSGVRRLITWNIGHMRGLGLSLEVLTPAEAA